MAAIMCDTFVAFTSPLIPSFLQFIWRCFETFLLLQIIAIIYRFFLKLKMFFLVNHFSFVFIIIPCTIAAITAAQRIQVVITLPVIVTKKQVQYLIVANRAIIYLTMTVNLFDSFPCLLFLLEMILHRFQNCIFLFRTFDLLLCSYIFCCYSGCFILSHDVRQYLFTK